MLAEVEKGESQPQAEPEIKQESKRGRGRAKKSASSQAQLSSYFSKSDLEEKAAGNIKPGDVGIQKVISSEQPSLVTGGQMRQYQLEGLGWLKSLHLNGLNGILADEMGLGKTLQTISLLAYLREIPIYGPFLIIAPLSTTSNWVNEFSKFTPDIPVLLYHGLPPDRAAIRKKHFKNPHSKSFPVVVTSYNICMKDQKYLDKITWEYIVIVCSSSKSFFTLLKLA